MAISRSQINRQLQNRGGITNISPRQNFGLGSKFKKFVRKVIPNEVSKVATAAAPFVAPFNPALAGAMAGIGSFDQTGSLSDAFKRGALTYGGGQAARYIGGAGFQQNPFTQGGAFRGGLEGFKGGFTTPFGTDTGLGKFFEKPNAPISEIQGIDSEAAKAISTDIAETGMELRDLGMAGQPVAGADPGTFISPLEYKQFQNITPEISFTESIKKIVSPDTTLSEKGREALDLLKQGGKAVFTKEGKVPGTRVLDKAVLFGTLGFAASYAEAKQLANEAGVDITESEYDEARKAEKQEQYANDLKNFFAGKKDGGRIGFANGTDEITIMETLTEDPFAEGVTQMYVSDEMGALPKIMKEGEGGVLPSDMGTLSREDFETEEDYERYLEVLQKMKQRDMRADGGRQGFFAGMIVKEGIKKLGKIIFSPKEKTFLFKNLAGLGGSDRSFTMPQLFKILKDPSKFPKDAKALKAFIELRMKKKDGGISSIPVRTNEAGVKELDMRSTGGFVPIGVKEKADDVPAMLSKNEFVLTADAVRGIGGGSVEKGSEKLYNLMKTAEQVGRA